MKVSHPPAAGCSSGVQEGIRDLDGPAVEWGSWADGSSRFCSVNPLQRPLPPTPSPLQERGSQKQRSAGIASKCAVLPVGNERILQVRGRTVLGFGWGGL